MYPEPSADTCQVQHTGATFVDGALLAETVRCLVAEFNPQRIYLFGSRARGPAREDSNYDVLVLLNAPEAGSHEDQVRAVGALYGLHWPVDAIVMSADRFKYLSGAAASLPATVKREGRLVYGA
jgi:uncharacterized protein